MGYLPAWLPLERALGLVIDLERDAGRVGPPDEIRLVFEISSAVLDGVVRARQDGKMLSADEVKSLAQRTADRRWRGRLPGGAEVCTEDIRRVWGPTATNDSPPAEIGTKTTIPSPAEGNAEPIVSTVPVVDPYKTGLPGRRSIAHLILQEFKRRSKEGECEPVLAAEARALQAWASATHSNAPTPKSRVIENQIRVEYRAHQRTK